VSEIKKKNNINFTLNLHDTLIIKGFAICFMLWHHLFLDHPEFGLLVQYNAILDKVCVAMFLFVSAYGLTIQMQKIFIYDKIKSSTLKNLLFFYIKRLSKLYVNFWVVFLIFVPISVFFFDRSLIIPYGQHVNIIKRLLYDFLGMQGNNSYNITWWFYQLIIVLYLIFPFLYILVEKFKLYVLLCFFLLLGFHKIQIPVVHDWLFQFTIGIYYALKRDIINILMNLFKRHLILLIGVFFMIIIAYLRQNISSRFGDTSMDGFFAVTWILLIILTVRESKGLNLLFAFLGKHSMNIFMVHTFIFLYFFHAFIYSFKYPILIFSVLMLVSLSISFALEFFKTKIGLYVLLNKINLKVSN